MLIEWLPAVSADSAGFREDPVAWNNDRHRIGRARSANRAGGTRMAYGLGDMAIRVGFSCGNGIEPVPDKLLERGSLDLVG